MKKLRAQLQSWLDRKTYHILRLKKQCKYIIALSEHHIPLSDFYQQVERYLQEEEEEQKPDVQ